jgi:hypothetical protein
MVQEEFLILDFGLTILDSVRVRRFMEVGRNACQPRMRRQEIAPCRQAGEGDGFTRHRGPKVRQKIDGRSDVPDLRTWGIVIAIASHDLTVAAIACRHFLAGLLPSRTAGLFVHSENK